MPVTPASSIAWIGAAAATHAPNNSRHAHPKGARSGALLAQCGMANVPQRTPRARCRGSGPSHDMHPAQRRCRGPQRRGAKQQTRSARIGALQSKHRQRAELQAARQRQKQAATHRMHAAGCGTHRRSPVLLRDAASARAEARSCANGMRHGQRYLQYDAGALHEDLRRKAACGGIGWGRPMTLTSRQYLGACRETSCNNAKLAKDSTGGCDMSFGLGRWSALEAAWGLAFDGAAKA